MASETSEKVAWGLLGLAIGAGGMYVLAKEDVWKANPTDVIAEIDVDEALYVGDGDDGVYINVAQDPNNGKWYFSAMVDSDTASFTETFIVDDGPYDTEREAIDAGRIAGQEWCSMNNVSYED